MEAAGQTPFWLLVGGLSALGAGVLLVLGWRSARGRRRREVNETQAYLKGVHYLLSDNPDAAIEELTRVVQVNTETIGTYFALGALFRRKGELERALRIHQNILLRPGLPDGTRAQARFELALDYRTAGMLAQAKEALGQFVKDPAADEKRVEEALALKRDLHIEGGEWGEAVEDERRLVKRRGGGEDHVLAHLLAGLGRAHLGAGRPDDALGALKEALKIDPDCVDAHLAAAELGVAQGQLKVARKHFDAAVERLPEAIGLAYSGLSDLYFRDGRYEELGEYLRGFVNRFPDVPQLRLALARYLRKRGLTDRAVEELRVALDLDPRFHDARQELGRILLEENMDIELRRQFEELLDTMGAEPGLRCERCGHRLASLVWRCPRCGAWDTIRRVQDKSRRLPMVRPEAAHP